MFQNTTAIVLYAIAVLGAQVGIVMMLVGRRNPKFKKYGLYLIVVSLIVYILAYIFA